MDMVDQGFNKAKPVKDCMSRQYPKEVFNREILKYIREFIRKSHRLPILKKTLGQVEDQRK
jgi:hypothetical protein